jgi:hypothetical protein
MPKIELRNESMPAFMRDRLEQGSPSLRNLVLHALRAGTINMGAAAARNSATAALEAEGIKADSLFAEVKATAAELATFDNGPGNEPGIAGVTVMAYFNAVAESQGAKPETVRSYARLTGQLTEAVRQNLLPVERLLSDDFTRPDVQRFLATDDAAARADVKAKVGEMVKGATAGYCEQLAEHLASFRYQRPEGAQEGSAEWTGRILKKNSQPAEGQPEAEAA